jgi:hypothetical protein
MVWDGCDVPYALRTAVRVGIDDDARWVMRVLLVMRHGVEFEAGRGGRCGNYTIRYEYLRLASQCSMGYIYTICTV